MTSRNNKPRREFRHSNAVPLIGQGPGPPKAIHLRHQPSPMAAHVIINGTDGNGDTIVNVIGGQTRLEWMAGMVASGAYTPAMGVAEDEGPVEAIVSTAEAIIAECDRRTIKGEEPEPTEG